LDFQKNLSTPNITTNDVYYKRQLTFISFNIHVLLNSQSILYTYDEAVAKKGADEVVSMMYHFLSQILPASVRNLVIFCDSCSGQNKNFTVMRFVHHPVHNEQRFESVKMIFPIRGHSYLECDRDMSLVNQKAYTEVPNDWRDVIRNSRQKPTPFMVLDCEKEVEFLNWSDYFIDKYPKKNPIPTRPLRVLEVRKENPSLIFHKNAFHGLYHSDVFIVKKKQARKGINSKQGSKTIPHCPTARLSKVKPKKLYEDKFK